MKEGQKAYDAVLLDNDGVLVELTDLEIVYDGVRDTFEEFDVEPSEEDVRRLVGVSADELLGICDAYGLDPDEFWRRRDANVSRVQREAFDSGLKPPYEDLDAVERLADGRSVAVVSNNQQATVDHFVERIGLSCLDLYMGREPTVGSLRRKKPSPYLIDEALDRIGVAAEDALYVGDSAKDAVAARRAGADSAILRRGRSAGGIEGGIDSDAGADADHTYVVDSLYDVERIVAEERVGGAGV